MKKGRKSYPLNQSPLYRLTTKRKLAALLGIPLRELKALTRSEKLYSESDIPKKNGGIRRIENPRRHLKIVQARIARLLGRICPPDYLFCPVKGRCYVTNAARHLGHRVVRTLDVKKYFPNTPRKRVFWFFRTVMNCNADVAAIVADIATYKDHLPTGSPLSPIMAFYAHYDVWEQINRLAQAEGITNSLYIDDLTISGLRVPERVMWDIKKAIHRSGLRYHKEKTFRDRPAEITGVIVRGNKLVPPNRQLLKKYQTNRAVRNVTNKREKEMLTSVLNGLSGQIAQINSANTERA